MEILGYGSHITVEGFQASASSLADQHLVNEIVSELAAMLEPRATKLASAALTTPDGSSSAQHWGESQISLHAFVEVRAWQMRLFTRREIPITAIFALLRDRLGTGRFESRLTAVGKVAPVDDSGLALVLTGDRSYARARLTQENVF